jgi:hypothetical protein
VWDDCIEGVLRAILAQTRHAGQNPGFPILFSCLLNVPGSHAAVFVDQAVLDYGGINGLSNDSGNTIKGVTQQNPDEHQDLSEFRFHSFSLKTLFN